MWRLKPSQPKDCTSPALPIHKPYSDTKINGNKINKIFKCKSCRHAKDTFEIHILEL